MNKKKVLVVDDEPAILRFVQAGLEMAGYDVVVTTSGQEAVEMARSAKPDLLLLDMLMVPMNGYEVLQRVRAFSRMPVLIFTARDFTLDQALKAGADDYLPKPFKPEDLMSKISVMLSDGDGKSG